MLTKRQVHEIKPEPFKPMVSYARFKDGRIPIKAKPHAFKRVWSFEGTHSFTLPDGTIEQRQGQYIVKMKR